MVDFSLNGSVLSLTSLLGGWEVRFDAASNGGAPRPKMAAGGILAEAAMTGGS